MIILLWLMLLLPHASRVTFTSDAAPGRPVEQAAVSGRLLGVVDRAIFAMRAGGIMGRSHRAQRTERRAGECITEDGEDDR